MLDCIDIHIEVPRVDDESDGFVGKSLSSHPFDKLRASLKPAQTIADLAGSEEIQSAHLAEALQYRPKLMHNTM